MEEIHGYHVQYPLQKKKISITDLTPSASKARRVGLLENQLFCCTLLMLEKHGNAYR